MKSNYRFCFFLILLLTAACDNKNPNVAMKTTDDRSVYDVAYVLNEGESGKLEAFLDSIQMQSHSRFVFKSDASARKASATDSLASRAFQELRLSEGGTLIFVSIDSRSSKILVSENIHQIITNDDLTVITKKMNKHFADGNFLKGLRHAFREISERLASERQQPT